MRPVCKQGCRFDCRGDVRKLTATPAAHAADKISLLFASLHSNLVNRRETMLPIQQAICTSGPSLPVPVKYSLRLHCPAETHQVTDRTLPTMPARPTL